MPALNFPNNPAVNDTYIAAGYMYKWDGTKWMTVQSGEKSMNQIMDEHKAGTSQHNINAIDWQGQIGFRNLLINGDMKVNQRFTGQQVGIVGNKYSIDRWTLFCAGAAASYAHSTTIDGVPAKQALQIIGVAGNTGITIAQSVESINCQFLIGQKMTLSGLVYCPAGKTINISANSMNAKDVVGAVTNVASKAIVSIGGWQLVSMTFVATSDCRSNGMVVSFSATEGVQAGQDFYLTNAQLELGECQTNFENRSYQIELSICKRYYEKGSLIAVCDGTTPYTGSSTAFPVEKRVLPTITLRDSAGNVGKCTVDGTNNIPAMAQRDVAFIQCYINNSLQVKSSFAFFKWEAESEL